MRLAKTGMLFALTLLSACGGDDNEPPVADAAYVSAFEDQAVSGQLTGTDPEGQPLTFSVVGTERGVVTSLTSDGAFTFEPEPDFYGTAGFVFSVTDDHGVAAHAKVSIAVENVNDPPRFAAVADLTNSPETEVRDYQLTVIDPDRDEHVFSISVADPSVVEATVDAQGRISLKALRIGTTNLEARVADAEYSDTTRFAFSAEEVKKGRILRYAETATGAVLLQNETDREIDLVLEHNGFPVFEDVESMVEYVQTMPGEFEGEHFARKLWRFLRDSVYHELPLETNTVITNRIFYDPWFTLNSLGWGLCGHVAGVYVQIAQAAGYEARVWGLEGHVVPEIKVDGRWSMYDPDLAVYYKNRLGMVANVEELAADPSLITTPVDPIFAGSSYQSPYDPSIAAIYSSTSDNYDGAGVYLPERVTPTSARIVLPPHARLTYPGQWTAAPPGRSDGTANEVQAYRQALIELQEGWTGELRLPWMAWRILGSGQVGINGKFFVVGSPELEERLRDTPAAITSLHVYANAGLQIVLFVNAVRFDIRPQTRVVVRGLNVWGVRVSGAELPVAVGGGAQLDASLRKPVPSSGYTY